MKKLIAWVMLIFVALSLWYLSSQPNLLAIPVLKKVHYFLIDHGINAKVLLAKIEYSEKLRPIYDVLRQHPNLSEFIVRKIAHVVVFFVFTISVFLLLGSYLKRFYSVFVLTGLITLGVAVIDEIHQSFVPGRAGKWLDVGIDSLGVILALVRLTFTELINNFRQKNN
ncbi:MAG: hypothetical protein FH758_14190 [Firmicutes bacterium]|nr:hypothetical protein [Bacillota bacterium]